MNKKTLALLLLAGVCAQQSPLMAQTGVGAEPQQNLYVTNPESARPYRIPAIAAAWSIE